MSPLYSTANYREFIKQTLAERARKNPAYSLRALARALEITPMYLSEIIRGKKNPSPAVATRIAKRLGLSSKETEYFRILVELESTRDALHKEALVAQARALHPRGDHAVHDLSVDMFRTISDWHHLAIRNLTEVEGFVINPRNVAKRLGIPPIEAQLAIERLVKLEMIEPDPARPTHYRRTQEYSLVQSAVPNGALRSFHRQTLSKAIESLETQSPQEKIVASQTFAFDPRDLGEADRIVDAFVAQIRQLSERHGSRKTEVYHLGVQLFNLTKPKGRKTK